ncbi:AMP-binding protein [Nonomuraea sp. NPDC059007]|uniref:AMP-binding protein n=1 Tax=Nonomuraea sp. NPDC059007 TaxID=3346692 RepID=UPI0036B01CCE
MSTAFTTTPEAAECVVPLVLRRRAEERPGEVFAVFQDGEEWTGARVLHETLAMAEVLHEHGVRPGDLVVSWLPNGPDALRTWFGLNELGAVYVPVNTALRGRFLEHVLANSGARLAVVHPTLAPRLASVETAALRTVLVPGHAAPEVTGLDTVPVGDLPAAPRRVSTYTPRPWDTYGVLYTSGTTGASKGVLCSYAHLWTTAVAASAGVIGAGDRYLVQLPLFHGGGTIGVALALYVGASVAVVDGFDTPSFWELVRRTGTTACTLLGAMTSFLAAREPGPDDRDHPLRTVCMVPLGENAQAFARRFGVDVYTLFNMTEVSTPLLSERNPDRAGACGRVRAGVEVRLVDAHDREVPDGETGEMIVRTAAPWAMNHGYHAMPDASAAAWRNGWFHTGDAFRREPDGEYFFVDRVKDAIRRRGENISSFELETGAAAYPGVREVAAVAVPSEHGEDEVLVVVAPVPGQTVDPAGFVAFCVEHMPHYMVPRYVRVVAELPKTPTNKVRKHVLRAAGVTADTWDREAAGIRVRRERLTAADG